MTPVPGMSTTISEVSRKLSVIMEQKLLRLLHSLLGLSAHAHDRWEYASRWRHQVTARSRSSTPSVITVIRGCMDTSIYQASNSMPGAGVTHGALLRAARYRDSQVCRPHHRTKL